MITLTLSVSEQCQNIQYTIIQDNETLFSGDTSVSKRGRVIEGHYGYRLYDRDNSAQSLFFDTAENLIIFSETGKNSLYFASDTAIPTIENITANGISLELTIN